MIAGQGLDGGDKAVIIVALITMVGGVLVAMINNRRVGSKAGEALDRIGVPNGKGNVVQMLETLLAGQTQQDQRMARIEERLNSGDGHLHRIDDRLDRLEGT